MPRGDQYDPPQEDVPETVPEHPRDNPPGKNKNRRLGPRIHQHLTVKNMKKAKVYTADDVEELGEASADSEDDNRSVAQEDEEKVDDNEKNNGDAVDIDAEDDEDIIDEDCESAAHAGVLSGNDQNQKKMDERELEERRRMAIQGLELQVVVHGCYTQWADLLRMRNKHRPKHRAESDVGKTACKSISRAITLWRTSESPPDERADSLEAARKSIQEVEKDDTETDNARRREDIYQVIIPKAVQLLSLILKSVNPTKDMDIVEVQPLIQWLEVVEMTADRARTWQPRPPSLGEDLKDDTHKYFWRGVQQILRAYKKHYDNVGLEEASKLYHEREERRVRASQEQTMRQDERLKRAMKSLDSEYLASLRQMKDMARQREVRWKEQGAQEARNRPAAQTQRHLSSAGIVDIDDLDDDGHSTSVRRDITFNGRGPQADSEKWTNDQERALVVALKARSGPRRFEAVAHQLGRDEASVGRRAMQLRRQMDGLIKRVPGDWAWLTSIPPGT